MKRRSFLQVVLGVGVAASAGFVSLCTKCKAEKVANSDPFDYGELYCSPEVMEDIRNWGVDQIDEQTKKEILAEEPQVAKISSCSLIKTKDLNENRYYDPHWNVNGSWAMANSRQSLISHLSGFNHNYKESYLNTLSTDELQKLHDNDHDSRSSRTRTWRWRR